ncbi:MAG: hypothetical protein AB7Q45_05880 [Planctomycetaceae bacterium]
MLSRRGGVLEAQNAAQAACDSSKNVRAMTGDHLAASLPGVPRTPRP